jgi:DNA-binding NtrC family response regulator
LKQQPWPGNVRQLENVVRKAVLLARGFAVTRENIEHILTQTRVPRPAVDQPLADYVSELLAAAVLGELQNVQGVLTAAVERELYAQAIARAQGNQAKAAKWLGVSRPTMREKLNHYGLRAPSAEG